MPAKTTAKSAAKPAPKRAAASKPRARRRKQPSHGEISARAYFIHIEEGSHDELVNWLRAERELTAA